MYCSKADRNSVTAADHFSDWSTPQQRATIGIVWIQANGNWESPLLCVERSFTCIVSAVVAIADADMCVRIIVKVIELVVIRWQFTVLVLSQIRSVVVMVFDPCAASRGRTVTRGILWVRALRGIRMRTGQELRVNVMRPLRKQRTRGYSESVL